MGKEKTNNFFVIEVAQADGTLQLAMNPEPP